MLTRFGDVLLRGGVHARRRSRVDYSGCLLCEAFVRMKIISVTANMAKREQPVHTKECDGCGEKQLFTRSR